MSLIHISDFIAQIHANYESGKTPGPTQEERDQAALEKWEAEAEEWQDGTDKQD